jgi:RNA polymerase sigma-70 factor (ECF subfamily)
VSEDLRLIDLTLAGDTAAFGQLVSRHQDRLFNSLVHITGSREEAEDVVQDTLIQAFTRLGRFERRASFYTWVYRIAFNLWISRRRRRRPVLSVEVGRELAGQEPVATMDTPLQRLEREERVELIRQALSALAEESRTILVLREIDGCCYETIADMLDVPVGTVRSRLHRARLQLKRNLELVLKEQA